MVKPIQIIWSYWDGPQDDLIKNCFKTWYKYLHDWEIIILDERSLDKFGIIKPSTWSQLSPATKSDVIRLNLLYKYGGIWMDASILLHTNFDWLKKYLLPWSSSNYFQIKIPWENWNESSFIVVPKKYNKFIGKWKELLIEVLEYWPHVEKSPMYRIEYTHNSRYFMVYQTHIYLIRNDPDFRQGIILPVNGIFALFPFIFPSFFEPRYFTKFIKGGRKILKYQHYIEILILIVLIVLICFKLKGKYFQYK